MAIMSICECCGRTTDKNFPFCPWCGEAKIKLNGNHDREILCQNNMDKKQAEQAEHMEKIGKKIDALEKELAVLVLSVEMAK